MINSKTFYKQFQINYFDYKTSYLNNLLDNYKALGLDKKILEYSDDDFIRAIKIDLRQTVFQAIETVFEIFFGLVPNINGKPTDRLIQKITLSPLPYSKIEKISSEENFLDFLNNLMTYPNSSNSTLG